MKNYFQFQFLFFFLNIIAQEKPNFKAIDSLYREDQFYLNITYNILRDKPINVSQNSLSAGVNAGFLRDFPLNKSRTFAVAPGIGLSFNNYKQNLIIQEKDDKINYSIISPTDIYNKNKLGLYYIDIPLEIRWRTSTYSSYKFWRVYAGVKWSYLISSRSSYIAEKEDFKINNNPDINKISYGIYLCAGYNAANIYVYYGLQDIFKNSNLNNDPLKIKTLNIGFMFYIL